MECTCMHYMQIYIIMDVIIKMLRNKNGNTPYIVYLRSFIDI